MKHIDLKEGILQI
uniref:Uncharacterized protein n=1 Tax=Lepeophtheirus salmonis TaxID=72036 RepID=A0A0K2UV95_LEPSM